jgi:hypothetical protein
MPLLTTVRCVLSVVVMSDAIEELERMAEEFERGAVELKETAGRLPSLSSRMLTRGESVGFEASAKLLRERAAELRGSIPAPQKPDRVEARQWWRFGSGVARLVTGLEERGGDIYACFNGSPYAAHPRDGVKEMLTSSDWTYLGNGERPATEAT